MPKPSVLSYGIHFKGSNSVILILSSSMGFRRKNLLLQGAPGRVAQSVGHLTHKSGVLSSIPGLATYFRFSFRFFKKGSCQLLAKVQYVHEVLVNRLGGLSLPRKNVVRLTDRPDMTLDVYRGRKTTMQQQQTTFKEQILSSKSLSLWLVGWLFCV